MKEDLNIYRKRVNNHKIKKGYILEKGMLAIMLDREMIKNILTLRYHPIGETLLPKLDWRSFTEYKGLSNHIQPLLEETIKKIIETNEAKVVGMGLSGGADSTTVLALTRKCFPDLKIKTFCVSFGDDDKEVSDAQHISNIYSTEHSHIHIDNPFKDLESQILIADAPKWNLYPYYLFKEISQVCDLALTGDGGDELFGGYVFRYKYIIENATEGNVIQKYLEAHNRDWVPDQKTMFAMPFRWNDIYTLLRPYFDNPLPMLNKVFLADYNGKLLYDFGLTAAAFSTHFDLKIVAPMLEPEVMYLATHIPSSLKYDLTNDLGKIILRQILLENSGYIPAIKSKIGWGMNLIEMWDKYVGEICESLFEKARFVKQGIINKEWLPNGLKKAKEHDVRYISKMFGLLALELWLKKNEI
jgi:asparagine synthase (glutamine-hydrolysing)